MPVNKIEALSVGFICPTCKAKTGVTDSRANSIGVRRRRKCPRGHLFTTFEMRAENMYEARQIIEQYRSPLFLKRLHQMEQSLAEVLDALQPEHRE